LERPPDDAVARAFNDVLPRSYLENGLAAMHDGAERDRAVLQHLVPRLVKIMQRTQARLDFDQAFHGLACVPLPTLPVSGARWTRG